MLDEIEFQRERLRREMQECINDIDQVASMESEPKNMVELAVAMRVALMATTAHAYLTAVSERAMEERL